MKKLPILKISLILIAAGLAIALLGFIWSGASLHAYLPYSHQWYSVIHLGD